MARYLILFSLMFVCISSFAQKSQELQKRNGFKNIKLGMLIDSLPGVKFRKDFKEKDEYPAKLYVAEDPEYQKIGEVDVKKVELKTYKGLIYQIVVTVDKDPRVMKALESIYGKSEYDVRNDVYVWGADSLGLRYRSASKNHLELEYSSYPVLKKMKEDKSKKVEAIADDF
jgi:hypothetical protein